MHTESRTAPLSVSIARGCVSSTGSQQGKTWLHNHHCDGWQSLDNSRLRERLAAASAECTQCSQRVHWSMASVRDARNSVGVLYLRPMFVSHIAVTPCHACPQTSCLCYCFNVHSWISLTATNYWTNNRVAVTALIVFTHVYCVPSTLCHTCRPTLLHVWRFDGVRQVYRTLLMSDTANCSACRPTIQAYLRVKHQWRPSAGDSYRRLMHDLVAFNRRLWAYQPSTLSFHCGGGTDLPIKLQ